MAVWCFRCRLFCDQGTPDVDLTGGVFAQTLPDTTLSNHFRCGVHDATHLTITLATCRPSSQNTWHGKIGTGLDTMGVRQRWGSIFPPPQTCLRMY